jgi:hypothetical protein
MACVSKTATMDIQALKKELTELFKDGEEEVYFRDTDEDNGIMSRFKDNSVGDNVICFIVCEYMPDDDTIVNLHYDCCYGGSDKLATIKTKYKLNHEWEDSCIAFLYKDEELYEDEDEEEEEEEEKETTKKAGSIDWNSYIYSLEQTIKQNQVVRSRCDDRISELEDIVEELENRLREAGIN